MFFVITSGPGSVLCANSAAVFEIPSVFVQILV